MESVLGGGLGGTVPAGALDLDPSVSPDAPTQAARPETGLGVPTL